MQLQYEARTFEFIDLVRLILDILRYLLPGSNTGKETAQAVTYNY